MNDKPILNESVRESLKCLTGGKAPFLKELLLEDIPVNVSLSPTDPKGDTSHLSLFFFLFFLFCSAILFTFFIH